MELIDENVESFAIEGGYLIVTSVSGDFGNLSKKFEALNIVPENTNLQKTPKS